MEYVGCFFLFFQIRSDLRLGRIDNIVSERFGGEWIGDLSQIPLLCVQRKGKDLQEDRKSYQCRDRGVESVLFHIHISSLPKV